MGDSSNTGCTGELGRLDSLKVLRFPAGASFRRETAGTGALRSPPRSRAPVRRVPSMCGVRLKSATSDSNPNVT